jgi:tRNA (guanine-N7-)-methyltransferase
VGFKPEFIAHVTQRRTALREELAALLPAKAGLVLEVGCGHGHFLARYAAENPRRLCLGVDMINERIARARRKATRARLDNCHFIRAEARECIESFAPGITFEEVWVLFPDPWPKKRHHKHRLLQPAFFEMLAQRAGQGARLYFRTDHGEYFAQVAAFLPKLKTWQPDPVAAWAMEHETVFQARAPSYQSLVAVRTSHPATQTETPAPEQQEPAVPTSPA